MQHSEWMQPTEDEVRELEYTQLEENNGNGVGSGKKDVSVPINSGIFFILLIAVIFGLWYRTSRYSTSES